MSRAFVCLALLGAAACPAPSDVTPLIHIDPRAAQRLQWFGERTAAGEPALLPPSPARVHPMKEGEELGGPGATGRPGDWLLENAEVVFVIGQVGGDGGPAGSGGNVIDAADARVRRDDLGRMVTSFGTALPEGVYRSLRSGTNAETDGSAWIEVTGRGLAQPTLVLTTRYTLHAPDRAMLLETMLENTGDAPIALESVGDLVAWGTAETVAPGEARGFAGPSSGAYVGAVGTDTSYALTSTDGSIEAVSGESWTQTAQRKRVTLAPYARTAYARVLVVGARPDTACLVGELALAAGLPVGDVKVTVAGSGSATTLLLTPEGSHQPLSLVEPFETVLPEGRYWITPLEGHRPIGPIDVKASHVATATVENGAVPGSAAGSAP